MRKRENHHLSNSEIEEIKKILLLEKRKIFDEISKEFGELIDQEKDIRDVVDEANESILLSHTTRLTNRKNLYVRKIEKSLKSIECGEYGMCEECGSEIPFSRLRARPTSTMCIVCKEASESEEAQNFFGRQSKSLGHQIQIG
ncbi:MAG: TraR/DksA C4-type zinc finger protein [Halobacteriovoraceae bacterium]|nr:TraR/DksA C4-type zinc finger protein [Halobacteriovoraceae bacterium]